MKFVNVKWVYVRPNYQISNQHREAIECQSSEKFCCYNEKSLDISVAYVGCCVEMSPIPRNKYG